jgi:hypothetical protein
MITAIPRQHSIIVTAFARSSNGEFPINHLNTLKRDGRFNRNIIIASCEGHFHIENMNSNNDIGIGMFSVVKSREDVQGNFISPIWILT